jgi:hypothetical protein
MGDKTEQDIKQYVNNSLGIYYALDGVLVLQDIGLADFPVNCTFKVIKSSIQRAVMQHLDCEH